MADSAMEAGLDGPRQVETLLVKANRAGLPAWERRRRCIVPGEVS